MVNLLATIFVAKLWPKKKSYHKPLKIFSGTREDPTKIIPSNIIYKLAVPKRRHLNHG